ncbi:hypothetical protein [uncultured Cohaesibacter sp.]|uniref:hypothetical protein n=1 Tax=uncultured Cohaesibacter sp. TaxID=1002546 RepID=UPI002AABC274|nr:hypothetical protein [uncultured Cohaesibacter sp.]
MKDLLVAKPNTDQLDMKISPAESQVELYQEGFEDNDTLKRASVGKFLSELMERIEDPLIVAVDIGGEQGKLTF